MQLRSHWRSHLRSLLLAGVLLLSAAWPVAAQKAVPAMIGKDIEHAARDIWAVWTSPFDAHPRDLLTGLMVLGVGVAISPADDDVDRWFVRNADSRLFTDVLEPFRKDGALYGGGALAPVAGAAYVVGIITKKQGVRDAIVGCGVTWLSNNVLRHQVLYRFIGRERPDSSRGTDPNWPAAEPGDQYNIRLNDIEGAPWGMHSFPGGHIANIVGCASFFGHRFKWGVVEPALYAVAGAVLVARFADRAHWMSDQWVGTVFGFAIGQEVAHQQLRRMAARNAAAAGGSASAAPVPLKDGFFVTKGAEEVRVGWQLRF
ncbi:MAG: phosphatase PAP2 family protein [Gemmatimonadaceae bacterium]